MTQYVEIEVWDRALINSREGWRTLIGRSSSKDRNEDFATGDIGLQFLAESHHRLYGRPWAFGRSYFNFLLENGLRPEHRVLDFGCGAGRLGIWIIPYLASGHYTGIDCHWVALNAFARYEIPLHGIAGKKPNLILDRSLSLGRIKHKFDVILDLSVSNHLASESQAALYYSFKNSLDDGGRIFMSHPSSDSTRLLNENGLIVTDAICQEDSLLSSLPHSKRLTHWSIITHA